MKRSRFVPVLALLAALLLSGCGPTKIGRILSDPTRYRDKSVSVDGRVTTSFGALVAGVYQVEDDTGKIYVISTGSGVPSRNSNVRVRGRVLNGITVAGKAIGTAIREEHHKVR